MLRQYEEFRFINFVDSDTTYWHMNQGAEDLKDYRTIILVGGLYKWLAKVLANKLKGCLSKVILKAQNFFMEGRQILDAVLMANEVID